MNVNDFIMANEVPMRLGFFFGIFAAMAAWELLAPKRALTVSKTVRWANNLGLVFFNSFILRLVFPAAAVGMAAFASEQGWGLRNYYPVPEAVTIVVSVIAMDFTIYLQHVMVHAVPALWRLQHVMVHAVPALWRLHRVHHSVEDDEANSNFGFSLSWWDRLFGTYLDQPRAGHQGMTIGIHTYRTMKQVSWLPGMLALPLVGKVTGYAINRREWSADNE